jgi:hypothetical protein
LKLILSFENFSFDYKTPIVVGKSSLSRNEAITVKISAENRKETVLHLCALPHYHRYNIREWQYMIHHFFSVNEFDFSTINFEKPFFNTTNTEAEPEGECNYVLESVLFAFIENNFPEALKHFNNRQIKLNGLFSNEMIFQDVPDCVKLKIRPTEKNLAQTISAIKELREKNPHCLFRFDGNRTFELPELQLYLDEIEKLHATPYVQYIEEPFKDFSNTYTFLKLSSVPVALDESVLFFYKDLEKFENCFYVLKPSLLGLSQCFSLMKAHAEKNIISSSYEFPTALRPFMYLASLNPSQFHGLDTMKFLPKEFSINQHQSFLLSF